MNSSRLRLVRALLVAGLLTTFAAPAAPLPNIVILFADDMGYADLSCYGAERIQTPHLDGMAREGIRFTSFYVAQPVCSASRAALLTGCYPNRIGIHGALGPGSPVGIADAEITLAELVKQKGYATAIFGKWHLGDRRQFLPLQHGFDEYLGLPYSNDMWPKHPTAKEGTFPDLPLIDGNDAVEHNPDQSVLTRRYTERATRFIAAHHDQPFLLYLAYAMPHVPIFASDRFKGTTAAGLYGDVVAEIDWSVGEIIHALRHHNIQDNTLLIFTSDNGPWLSYGNHAGSAGPLREGKGTCWEGGVRVPFIARWPGRIPAGTQCDEPAMTIDLFPTIARLIDAALPHHPIDGLDIWPLLSAQPAAQSPHDAFFFYYHQGNLEALRSGPWKLQLPHEYRTLGGQPGGRDGVPVPYQNVRTGLALYDLTSDPGELHDVSQGHPEIVRRLSELAETARADLGDSLTQRTGSGVRLPGRVQAE
jgi:arylsulfatase A-like enzyme